MSPTEIEPHVSVRAANVLNHAGVKTWAELATWTPLRLLRLKNAGRKMVAELSARLEERGLALQPDPPPRPKPPKNLSATDAEIRRRARIIVGSALKEQAAAIRGCCEHELAPPVERARVRAAIDRILAEFGVGEVQS